MTIRLLSFAVAALMSWSAQSAKGAAPVAADAYAFSFTAIDGKPLPLTAFRGKAIMVVNTASFCGFTPQYEQLEALWKTYRDRGFVILGVPSNDFGGQEPGSSSEIKEFCETKFSIDFPLTEKAIVAGKDAHPFYRWASDKLGVLAEPRWNFHKYLIDSKGNLVDWFSSITEPNAERVTKAIEAALPR